MFPCISTLPRDRCHHGNFTLPWIGLDSPPLIDLRPLHTQAKSRDHENVRAQEKVSKGCPNTLPKSRSVVTDPQLSCEVICDRALNQMLFQCISIHAGSSHMIKQNKSTVVNARNAMVSWFCVRPTSKIRF